MHKKIDLTEGRIANKLVLLSLPIIGTSFIQMGYNLTDMLWLGNYSTKAVAAVGTAGFFTWFGNALALIAKTGAEVGVAQSIGKKNEADIKSYIHNAVKMTLILGLVYGIILFIFRSSIIDFFKIADTEVVRMAEIFLAISAVGIIPLFINPVFTGIFNASGDSKTPFVANTIGLVTNITLDPILIYGVGPIKSLGVIGAGLATVSAQFLVTILFLYALSKRSESYFKINVRGKFDKAILKNIFKIGLPVAMQNGLFSCFSMIIGRIISPWGYGAIAAQKVGSQIEAISWLSTGGLATALGAFVGQNYGAKKGKRIYKGYFITIALAVAIGIFATLLLIFGGEAIFSLFSKEPQTVAIGKSYLRILGFSQLFMCIEITTAGVFNGLGKTIYPSVMSIILTGLRIPLALFLAYRTSLALDGVWWSISISSIFKGIVIIVMLYFFIYKKNVVSKEEAV